MRRRALRASVSPLPAAPALVTGWSHRGGGGRVPLKRETAAVRARWALVHPCSPGLRARQGRRRRIPGEGGWGRAGKAESGWTAAGPLGVLGAACGIGQTYP